MLKTISIIGSGALGKSLGAHFFSGHKVHYFSRTPSAWKLPNGKTVSSFPFSIINQEVIHQLKSSDLIVIASQDQAIQEIVGQLKGIVRETQWMMHLSGSVHKSILDELNAKSGVMHFLQTFQTDSYLNESIFNGISSSYVGNEELLKWLQLRTEVLKMNVIEVTDEQKKRLHIAAVFACNFQHVLFDATKKVGEQIGIDTLSFLKPLIESTFKTIQEKQPIHSLSGPVKRSDINALRNHVSELQSHPELVDLYTQMSLYLIEEQKKRNDWNSEINNPFQE